MQLQYIVTVKGKTVLKTGMPKPASMRHAQALSAGVPTTLTTEWVN